jgi:hypothetical protein
MAENAFLFPPEIQISALTGAIAPSTGSYDKRLRELREIYSDKTAFDHAIKMRSVLR